MKTLLQKSSYEKLIGQTVYIEENMPSIQETLVESKILTSETDARLYFEKYIKKVEALFQNITIVDYHERINRIPFVVLESSFTLRDSNDRVYYCRLIHDNTWGGNRHLHEIYFLSEIGMTLLLKAEESTVTLNMGIGYLEHKISSIRI